MAGLVSVSALLVWSILPCWLTDGLWFLSRVLNANRPFSISCNLFRCLAKDSVQTVQCIIVEEHFLKYFHAFPWRSITRQLYFRTKNRFSLELELDQSTASLSFRADGCIWPVKRICGYIFFILVVVNHDSSLCRILI